MQNPQDKSMHCHIELNNAGGWLWLADPKSGLGPSAPHGFDTDIAAPELVRLLKAAEDVSSYAMPPLEFAQRIAKELQAVLPQLPHYSRPPEVKIPKALADELKLESSNMTVADFISRYLSQLQDE